MSYYPQKFKVVFTVCAITLEITILSAIPAIITKNIALQDEDENDLAGEP